MMLFKNFLLVNFKCRRGYLFLTVEKSQFHRILELLFLSIFILHHSKTKRIIRNLPSVSVSRACSVYQRPRWLHCPPHQRATGPFSLLQLQFSADAASLGRPWSRPSRASSGSTSGCPSHSASCSALWQSRIQEQEMRLGYLLGKD